MASSKKGTGSKKSNDAKKAGSSKKKVGAKKTADLKEAAAPVSFAAQISPLFRTMDVQCMRARGVFLKKYDYMKDPDNANLVLSMLQPDAIPRMPYGGPYWTAANIQLLQDWIDGGFQP